MRLEAVVERFAEARRARPSRAWLGLGTLLFLGVVGAALAYGGMPPLSSVRAYWIPPALILAFATLVTNGAEFAISARFNQLTFGWRESLRVSAMGSAANVLPIPGAALVRVHALRSAALSTRLAVATTLGVGLVWLAMGGFMAAVVLLLNHQVGVGLTLLVLAGLWIVAGVALLIRSPGATVNLVAGLAVFELASTVVTTVRILLVGRVLFPDVDLVSAACLALVGIVSTAAGVLPGGLGLREALSGGVAGISAIDAPSAVLVAGLDRVVSYVALALVALWLAVVGRARGDASD